jgi:hypothetical protein
MEHKESRLTPASETGHDITSETQVLNPQIEAFFKLTRVKLEGRGISDLDRRMEWAEGFTQSFVESRTSRALEIGSEHIKEAQEIARNFYGSHVRDLQVTCMDGRNQPEVSMSRVPHVGGVMRTAAGDFEGYREGADGKVHIDPNSNTYESIDRALTSSDRRIYYSFDSHFGCAARGASETLAGSVARDGGLAADIKRKMKLADAILDQRENLGRHVQRTAEFIPLFYSYDPHDGTMTMGLEATIDKVGVDGYSAETLSSFHNEGKIIKAWDFLEDESITQELRAHVSPVDFRNKYTESMHSNWKAISDLYSNGEGTVFTAITEKLMEAYKHNAWQVGDTDDFREHKISQQALLHKAKIMLQNIVTRWSIAENERDGHAWPFGEHKEEAVVLTEGGNGPYPVIDTFAVFNKGEIPDNTEIAIGIVRKLRTMGAVSDGTHRYSQEELPNAPVMILNTVVVRGLTPIGREFFSKQNQENVFGSINWDEIALENNPNAYKRVVENVESQLFDQADISHKDVNKLVNGISQVIGNFQWLTSDHDTQPLMQTGSILVCSMLLDEDRKPFAVIPLVY